MPLPCPIFIRRLAEIESELDGADRYLARIFFTIVSETLISSFLAEVPKDQTVIRPIRELVADHAIDEGRHHSFFSQLLDRVWPALDSRQQRVVGELLPKFIHAFLDPDLPMAAAMLIECELSDEEIATVLHDVYQQRPGDRKLEAEARHTLAHLARVGVFDDAQTRSGFIEAGIALPA